VVVVGIGESGADLVKDISEVASSCHLVVRKYPFCIPRMLADGHPNDR
jgi:cation diffusion facilitator CzcD-associated flavoprotein CzcO